MLSWLPWFSFLSRLIGATACVAVALKLCGLLHAGRDFFLPGLVFLTGNHHLQAGWLRQHALIHGGCQGTLGEVEDRTPRDPAAATNLGERQLASAHQNVDLRSRNLEKLRNV
jgi:hypothetical protein